MRLLAVQAARLNSGQDSNQALTNFLNIPSRRFIIMTHPDVVLSIDFSSDGRPIGIEITAPASASLEVLNRVLAQVLVDQRLNLMLDASATAKREAGPATPKSAKAVKVRERPKTEQANGIVATSCKLRTLAVQLWGSLYSQNTGFLLRRIGVDGVVRRKRCARVFGAKRQLEARC